MVEKTVVVLTDDMDGTELRSGQGETVRFALDKQQYEIDLSTENAKKLRGALQFYVDRARKLSEGAGLARRRSGESVRRDALQTAAIRDWARRHGHKVSERGRIPRSVIEAFEARR